MKHVTIVDIANELNVSVSAVSRALRGDDYNVNKETKQKILEAAKRMGYKRNELAVNLRKQNTRTIGIIVPEMVTPFYMNFITCAQESLNNEGYRVMLAQSHEDADTEKANLQMMEDYRVEGIIISACHNKKNIAIYKDLLEKGTPLVFIDRTIEDLSVPKVRINDYMKAFFMVEHLVRLGKRNIVHLAGPSYIRNSSDRKKAYKDVLEKFQIPFDSEYLMDSGVNYEDGERSMEAFIQKKIPFDAVFCFTEMSAFGAKSCLQKHLYSIPEDVAICCISGTTLSTLVHPTMTAVEQPVKLMAKTSVELMIEKLSNPQAPDKEIVLEAEIIIREST